jgi:hypothetical protein
VSANKEISQNVVLDAASLPIIGPVYLAVVMGVLIARITASETGAEVETSLTESDAHKNTI